MNEKAMEIYSFIQERCLWQFHSREWDRTENINEVMNYAYELLAGKGIKAETASEKCHYADAKILVTELNEKYSWLKELNDSQKKQILDEVRAKLVDITITKSQNCELRVPFY